MKCIHISLLALLALPLAAQDSGLSAGGALIAAPKSYFGSYDKVVNNNLGYLLNGSYTFKDAFSENVTARISVGYGIMPGKSKDHHSTFQRIDSWKPNPDDPSAEPIADKTETRDVYSHLKTSLSVLQLTGDLIVQTGIPSLRGIVGISLNKYWAKFNGTEITGQEYNAPVAELEPTVAVDHNAETEHHFPFKDTGGIKGGIRLGFEYSFSKCLSAELLFQQTELAGQNTSDPVDRAGGVNPAWLQIGVRCSF